MFKHILLPTDGSELSAAAIQQGIRFAKSIGAKVTGLCVMLLQEMLFYDMVMPIEIIIERIPGFTVLNSLANGCQPT